jgi:branched-subunit amino acid permease
LYIKWTWNSYFKEKLHENQKEKPNNSFITGFLEGTETKLKLGSLAFLVVSTILLYLDFIMASDATAAIHHWCNKQEYSIRFKRLNLTS